MVPDLLEFLLLPDVMSDCSGCHAMRALLSTKAQKFNNFGHVWSHVSHIRAQCTHILAATVLRHPSGGIDCVGICPNTQEEERNDIIMVFAQQQRMIVLSLFSMFPRFFNVAKVGQCKSPARVREFSLSSTKDSNCDVR